MTAAQHLAACIQVVKSVRETMSERAFAAECGLRRESLRGMLSDDWSPSVRTLKACAEAADRILVNRARDKAAAKSKGMRR